MSKVAAASAPPPSGAGAPIPIATPETVKRLDRFFAALQKLCDKYEIDLESKDMDNGIKVFDRRRAGLPAAEPTKEWPYVASFSGVDHDGVYRAREYGARHEQGYDIEEVEDEDWCAEDYAALKAARAAGEAW